MSVAASGKALAHAGLDAGADRLRRRRDRHPPAADPGRGHRDRLQARHRSGRGVRHLGRLRRLLLRRSRSAADMVRGGTAEHVLVIGVERLSDLTDPTDRGTAFIFADGAGAAVVGPVRRARHRPGRLGLGRRAVRPDPAARGLARRVRPREPARCRTWSCRATRCSAGRRSRWPRSRGGARRCRHHRRRPRRVRPAPGQHAHHRRHGPRDEAARARRDRPRHRRAGQHLRRVDPAGHGTAARGPARPAAAIWPC